MATTPLTPIYTNVTVPEPLVLMAWAKKTWESALKKAYFNKFMGNDANSIIQIKEDLKKGAGTTIRIALLLGLSGPGIIEDDTLKKNEEAISYRNFDVPLSYVRNGVILKGIYEEQKTQIDMRKDAHSALTQWLSDYIDKSIFAILTGTKPPFIKDTSKKFPFDIEPPTTDRLIIAGGKTSEQAIEEADTFTPELIGIAKRMATENEDYAIRPVNVDGRQTYVMVIDPYQARDLKANPDWIEAQKYANIRGEKNPIFSGALGIYDGVVIHECGRVPRTESGQGSSAVAGSKYNEYTGGVKVGHAIFLGAQSAVMAEGMAPRWVQKNFDYENQYGISIGRMFGLKRSMFQYDGENWSDFGCINILTSSVDDKKI